jgi:ribosome maturation factor RimP
MSNTTVIDAITAVVRPIVAGLELDLYDLEFNGGILRITIDTPPGSAGGVTLDQLALVNRLVGRDLDHQDPIPGHYTLEVTSPGLERLLRIPAHFQREVGKTVSIRLRATTNGERRLQGVLIAADDTTATIRMDDAALTERVVALDAIDRARTVFHWGGADKPNARTKKPATKPADTTTRGSRAAAATGGVKPAPGPSDELDPTTFEEASAS